MNKNNWFWGFLLILIGGLFLLDNLDVIRLNWILLLELWPILLVYLGLKMIFSSSKGVLVPIILVILFGISISAFLGMRNKINTWHDRLDLRFNDDYDYEEHSFDSDNKLNELNFSEPFEPDFENLKLNLELGAGKFEIADKSSKLIDIQINTHFNGYEFFAPSIKKPEISLRSSGNFHFENQNDFKNNVQIQLHPKPIWSIDAEVGLAKVDFDLSEYKIEKFVLSSGAAQTKLKFGDKSPKLDVKVETGIASLEIKVPKSVACQIVAETALASSDFKGFQKVDENTYQSSNFESSTKKIFIELEAGISKIEVKRY